MWTDFDRSWRLFEQLRQQLERSVDGCAVPRLRGGETTGWRSYPPINLHDAGQELLLEAELPGVSEKTLSLTVNQEVLTLSGERVVDVPAGYRVQRQERRGYKFSRSLSLPCKIDPEKVSATYKAGVLTVRLAKAPEAQPRQITVKAQ